MSTVNLTSREQQVLINWPTNYNDAESQRDDNASWAEASDFVGNGLSIKTVKGILGSLAKKGLVEGGHEKANGVPGDLQVLSSAGIDAVFRLRAEMAPAPVDAPLDAEQAALDAAVAAGDQEAAEALLEGQVTDTAIFLAAQAEADAVEAEDREAEGGAEEVEEATKLVVILDGKPVESRRVPSAANRKLVTDLVAAFGGKTFTAADAEGAGFDGDTLRLVLKRIRSWYSAKAVTVVRGMTPGWTLAVTLPVAELEAAVPAEAAAPSNGGAALADA